MALIGTILLLVQDFQHLPLLEEAKEDTRGRMVAAVVLEVEVVVLEVLQEMVELETQVLILQ